jgi:arginase family enzyme
MLITKIPFDRGGLGKSRGCAKAPDQIIEKLKKYELNEAKKEIKFRTKDIHIDNNNIKETNKTIHKQIHNLRPNIIIGGDHSITYSTFKAFKKIHPKNPGLIIFDAHPDCENNFSPPSHEDFLQVLIEENHIDPKNIILLGLRAISKNENKYLISKKILYFDMRKITADGIHDTCDTLMENCRKFESFYLSIDIDAVDPSAAPGTGYPEPAGMSARDLIYFIKRLKLLKNLKMADIVEVNPMHDQNNQTINLAAKLISELL